MGPNNADIFRYLSSLPARQTVLKDAHEVFKAAITTQDCCWEEKFLRNIEFNNLGISEAHILDNTNHKEVEAGAVDGGNLLYSFLVVKFDDPDNEQRGNLHETAHNCIQGGSVSVRMVERLRHRLAERGGNIPGLDSSVFSFVLNRTTASIYFSYAWDETSEHICLGASTVLFTFAISRKLVLTETELGCWLDRMQAD
ncbi:hypothetical protein H9L39_08519, partial [Fusarium oxysporum f. sp. albedinis]